MMLPVPDPAISCRNLVFAPDTASPAVLGDWSFYIAPGEALGVIGKSGAGKSTLAKCVLGSLVAQSGEVRIGSANSHKYPDHQRETIIGYLPQEPQFFPTSIASNIARLSPKPSIKGVVRAAQAAGIHDVILGLKEGYDTVLHGSSNLSVGQMRLMALARAMYLSPPILILDEPSAGLDANGCRVVNRAIEETKNSGGAVMVISHRPGVLTTCDKILVLERGKQIAFGTRDHVLGNARSNAEAAPDPVLSKAANE